MRKKFPKVCFEKSIGIQYWADLVTGQFVGKCWYLDNFYSSSGRVVFGISSDREDEYSFSFRKSNIYLYKEFIWYVDVDSRVGLFIWTLYRPFCQNKSTWL